MSDTSTDDNIVVLFLRVPAGVKKDLEALAENSGKSNLNAFMLPYLNAIRKGDIRMMPVVETDRLITVKKS